MVSVKSSGLVEIAKSPHTACARLFQFLTILIMKAQLLFFILFSTTALAQVQLPTNDAGLVQYQETVVVPDKTRPARQLMTQVRSWANQEYPAQNEAEQQFSPENNILFIRTFYPIGDQSVRYTLTIETKYGRYRATLTDLFVEGDGLAQAQPVRPVSTTAEELSRVSTDSLKNDQLIEQIATNQATLYKEIDKACRATLASLKAALTAKPE